MEGSTTDGSRIWKGLALLVALVIAGCALVESMGGGGKDLVFSHRIHVEVEGLECINCHENASVYDDPGMPTIDLCAFCHDELDEERAPDRRIDLLFDEEGPYRAQHASQLTDEIIFGHLAHVESAGECSDCHRDIERNPRITPADAVTMEQCIACHDTYRPDESCSVCHTEVDEAWSPPDHFRQWGKVHGMVVRAGTTVESQRCDLCHTESTCVQCHQSERPENHDEFWRLRGHSIVATIDRQNCWTCHRDDYCSRCHMQVLPLSHTGTFGSPRSTHCLTCHFPLRGEGCITCHEGTPSHDLGPPKPAWHTPDMNCRMCHGVGNLPLSHVDNGSNCNTCHP